MKPIRVGIVGCGVIAPTHAACYRKHADVQLTWASDLDLDKARALARDFEIPQVTADVRQMLEAPDVDLVSICTDHASHAPITCAALAAGRHVLCEKALAHDTAGLDAMLQAGDAHPERVFAGIFQHRHEPLNQRLRDLIRGGALGTLLTAGMQMRCWRGADYYRGDAWRGTWSREGGAVLINQAIHYIDQLLWLTGGAESAVAMIGNLTHRNVIETEDTAAAVLKLRCGALGVIEATASSHLNWESNLSFHGDQGAIDIRDDKPLKVDFRDKAVEAAVKARLDEAIAPKGAEAGKTYYGTGHLAQIADFAEAVRDRRAPYVTAESAADTLGTVFDIYDSARLQNYR